MRGRLLASAALAAAVTAAAAACGPPNPPPGVSPVQRFEWAEARFEEGKHEAAIRAFRNFLVQDPLNPLVDSAQYLIGEAFLRSGRALQAITEFEQLTRTRPNSPQADDAQFGLCRAHWELSPGLPKEQEHTRRAAEECTRLLEFFSDSPWADEARTIRSRAGAKLAEKSYRIARFYFDKGLYESANIYLEKALAQAPAGASIIPEVLGRLHRSYRRIGFDAEAEAIRRRLLREWPDSPEARELGNGPPPGDGVGADGVGTSSGPASGRRTAAA